MLRELIPQVAPDIRFVAFGQPKTAGSKRAFVTKSGKAIVTEDCKASKDWRLVVADAARRAYRGPLLGGALAVDFVFVLPRPRSHYGSGRNAGRLKGSAPSRPATRPDVLKLARAAEDALSGVLWEDDSRITTERLDKVFGAVACVCVRVRRDDGEGAPEWARKMLDDMDSIPFGKHKSERLGDVPDE